MREATPAYVGMIGSKTKKATFRSWYLKTAGGSEADLARLVSPIGGHGVRDKRPAVIAALAVAEILGRAVGAGELGCINVLATILRCGRLIGVTASAD